MRIAILLAPLLLLAPLALAESSVHERNVGFLRAMIDADPATPATMPDGRVIPLALAIDEAAARAGSVDLAALASDAGDPSVEVQVFLGDIWIIEQGPGSCTSTVLAPGSPVFFPIDSQFWLYNGGFGTMTSPGGYYTQIISWTTKTFGSYEQTGWALYANTDFYCFNYAGMHFAFPFANGYVQVDAEV